MVKNKRKFNASSFGLIALSLMLVASLVLGLTGAWFTDTKSGTGTATFGEIKLDTLDPAFTFKSTSTTEKFVPGDELNLASVKLAATSEKAWVRVKITVESDDGVNALPTLEYKDGETWKTLAATQGLNVYTTAAAVEAGSDAFAGMGIRFATANGNDYMNDIITIALDIQACQHANVANAAAAATIMDAIFVA